MGNQKIFKIMLADDDPDDRDLFAEAISEADNANLASVPNGIELMKTLKTQPELPDFVFLDLNMPEKSGKECLKEIRDHERLKDLNVIIFSTSSSLKDINDTFEMGANLYFTKPNSFTELKKTILSILTVDWSKYSPQPQKDAFVFKPVLR